MLSKCIILLALFIALTWASASPNVNVQLKATWKSTTFLQEASEYFGNLFFDYFDRIPLQDQTLTDKQQFQSAIDTASNLQDASKQKLLEYALSTRYFSPKVQLFQQLAQATLQAASLGSAAPSWFVLVKHGQHHGCIFVDANTLEEALRRLPSIPCSAFTIREQIYPFDHVFPTSAKNATHTAMLYGLVGSQAVKQVHNLLARHVNQIVYVFRHYDASASSVPAKDSLHNTQHEQLMNLQGYGVELQIKNLEYKQMDDSILHFQKSGEKKSDSDDDDEVQGMAFSELIAQNPQHANDLRSFKEHLIAKQADESSSLLLNNNDGLKKWELKDIGLQAAQLILKAPSAQESLTLLQQVSQDFPSWSSSLTKIKLDSDAMKQEIQANQQEHFEAGKNYLIVNGLHQEMDKISAFNLFDTLKTEMSLVHSLTNEYYLPKRQLASLLRATPSTSTSAEDYRFDLVRQFKNEIGYINDVAHDPRYGQFPVEVQSMLWPTYYGQMRFIRKNLFESVFIVDPSTKAAVDAVNVVNGIYNRGYPVRFGFLFVPVDEIVNAVRDSQAETMQTVDVSLQGSATPMGKTSQKRALTFSLTSVSAKLWIVLEYLHRTSGLSQAMDFLNKVRGKDTLTEESIKSELGYWTNYDNVINNKEYREALVKLLNKCVEYLGIGFGSNVVPAMLFNGRFTKSFQGNAEQVFWNALQPEYQEVQNLIRNNVLTDNVDIQTKIMEHYNAFARFNPALFSDGTFVTTAKPLHKLNLPFIHFPGTESNAKPVSHLVVADLNKLSGVQLALEAIKMLNNPALKSRSRVAIVPIAPLATTSPFELVSRMLTAAGLVEPSPLNDVIEFLNKIVQRGDEHAPIDASTVLALSEKSPKLWKQMQLLNNENNAYTSKFAQVTQSWIHSKPNDVNFVITNGRLIQITQSQPFSSSDFEMLDNLEFKARAMSILENLESITLTSASTGVAEEDLTSSFRSDWMFGVVSTLAYSMASNPSASKRTRIVAERIRTNHCAIKLNSDAALSLPVVVIINPLSAEAQKMSSYILALATHFQFDTSIVLNPLLDNTEVPLKSWYRYVLEPMAQFDNAGKFLQPSATFKKVASRNILTMSMDVPETWLIESTYAIDDLDNINLQAYKRVKDATISARYQLENIIVSGSCIDLDQPHNPPRGLQLELHPQANPIAYSDTLVMANYGYFQLKANPNVWSLTLSDRHSTIYSISNDEPGANDVMLPIYVTSFDGPILNVKIQKRPGMQDVELLEENDGKHGSIWGRFKSAVFGQVKVEDQNNATQAEDPNTINVFSIASGHMYERLLKIMALSVVKNTKRHPIKFWFIKNYLSPQFKQVLPLMAKQYNFSYQFVTYKWPTWLHKQTQKQRIIWAYKVLFLDVLFPLKVKKIIYVDSDQVTRADLSELYHDLDMQGKSLAYTPMGDSRKDMEGYRFWKTGYWASHLNGKQYHISALYVVDIDRMRKMYAGDQFRMYYDNLSKDPNSLSNLDQDLPNYAQHVVPIHSLDKSWLWCETWCSDEDKKTAKTIDLCNNPMTKEHKLESAKRIIPEWVSLDEEVKAFEKTLQEQGKI